MKERKPDLLVSGPQHIDGTRPISASARRLFERADPLGIAIVSAFLKKSGVDAFHFSLGPGRTKALKDAVEEAGRVWISSRFFDISLAQEAIEIAKRQSKKVIVGGYGPTFNPEAFADADCRVYGEAEPVLERVIGDLLARVPQPEYDSRLMPPFDLENYTWPDRSIFSTSGGLRIFKKHSQEWQRGCINFCPFCSPTKMQPALAEGGKRKIRVRLISDIIAEIESMGLKRGDNLFSVDLNTSAIPEEELYQLFTYLKGKGIRWYTEGTIAPLLENLERVGFEKSLLRLMSALDGKGGCYSFLYGADDLAVEKVKGSQDKEIGLVARGVETFRALGVPLNLSIVVGLDHHRFPDSFFQTAFALQEVRAPYAFIHVATPYSGTVWGNQISVKGRILDKEPGHYNHRRVVHQPQNMAPRELQQGYYWLLRALNSPAELQKTFRRNFSKATVAGSPVLGTIQTGIIWGLETWLSVQELSARGLIEGKIQRELDEGYKEWKGKR